MTDIKMSPDAAQDELSRIEDSLDVAIPDEARQAVLRALSSGRLSWDEAEQEFTLTLRKPIDAGSVTVTDIVVREPNAGEMTKANRVQDAFDQTIKLLSYVTGQPMGYIERIGSRDLVLLGTLIGFFR